LSCLRTKYSPSMVAQPPRLPRPRWNKSSSRWAVPIHWKEGSSGQKSPSCSTICGIP
jgi:hypothetical protein